MKPTVRQLVCFHCSPAAVVTVTGTVMVRSGIEKPREFLTLDCGHRRHADLSTLPSKP